METPILVWLDKDVHHPRLVGGKGASLSRLAAFGVPVPAAFILTTEAYRHAIGDLAIDDGAPGVQVRAAIEARPLPETIAEALRDGYTAMRQQAGDGLTLAVRSSATAEDSAEHSFAGLHDTILGVRDLPALEAAVRRCWASLWTDRAVAYRRERGVTDVAIAVVVQQMVLTDVSVVAFTADPISGREDRVVINATWGLGEALVSGIVTPDHIVVDELGAVLDYVPGEKAAMVIPSDEGTRVVGVPRALRKLPTLGPEQLRALVETARRVAERFGFATDLEAGFAADNLFVFQARPITTLARAA
jgi:pyruvate,water dikinase